MTPEQLRLKTIHDQEQEWTEGREWYRSHEDKHDIAEFFLRVNEGTREAFSQMTDEECAVTGRLAVLALMEIIRLEEYGDNSA
jgi:hypothetical protein